MLRAGSTFELRGSGFEVHAEFPDEQRPHAVLSPAPCSHKRSFVKLSELLIEGFTASGALKPQENACSYRPPLTLNTKS